MLRCAPRDLIGDTDEAYSAEMIATLLNVNQRAIDERQRKARKRGAS